MEHGFVRKIPYYMKNAEYCHKKTKLCNGKMTSPQDRPLITTELVVMHTVNRDNFNLHWMISINYMWLSLPRYTGWGDESWTAFCGLAAAAVGGL
jgi:hypothetical protein